MVKLSLLVMLVLTVVIATGLRWREERIETQRPAQRRAPAQGGFAAAWVAAQKHKANRWVTAAALATVATMLIFGGLNWLRIWNG